MHAEESGERAAVLDGFKQEKRRHAQMRTSLAHTGVAALSGFNYCHTDSSHGPDGHIA